MNRTLRALESFLELSEAMAGAAVAQEWEALVEIGEQRGVLVDQLPADLGATLPPAEQAHARTIIERCKQLDAKTLPLMEAQHKALRVLLREPTSQ